MYAMETEILMGVGYAPEGSCDFVPTKTSKRHKNFIKSLFGGYCLEGWILIIYSHKKHQNFTLHGNSQTRTSH